VINEFLAKYRKLGPGGTTIIVVHKDDLIGPDLRWPLRIAKLENADITVLVCVDDEVRKDPKEIKLAESAEQPAYENDISERMYSILDEYLGPEQWTNKQSSLRNEEEQTEADSQSNLPLVKLRLSEFRGELT